MNWLEMSGIVGVAVFFLWVYAFIRWRASDFWYAGPTMITCVGLPFCVMFLSLSSINTKDLGYSVKETSELIFLENNQSVSGNFLGHSNSGLVKGSPMCSFAIRRADNTIQVISSDVSNVTFHPIKGENYKVEKHVAIYYHPHSLKGKQETFWNDADFRWHITISEKNINKFIRFN